MTEAVMKELLVKYVAAEMELVNQNVSIPPKIEYSKKYKKKIKRIFMSERYFNSNLMLGNIMPKIAVVFIIFFVFVSSNFVSARFFGVRPWEYAKRFVKEYIMENYIFGKPNEKVECAEAISDFPTCIPNDYKQSDYRRENDMLIVTWDNSESEIWYTREKINENASLMVNTEGEKELIEMNGLDVSYFVNQKEKLAWMYWMDKKYFYLIQTNDLDNKENMLNMMQSMYEANEK